MTINGFASKAAALRHLRDAGFPVSTLLAAPEANPKVAKNGKLGVMTFPMHLAPADLSGFNTCPMASAGCKAACLHTAGNPAYMAQKEVSRIAKTRAYMTERKAFMALLTFEIAAARRKASKAGMECGVRLNATSDISWERVAVEVDGESYASVMAAFPDVQFYDYTKVTKRALACARGDARWPTNYHLTFSKSEDNDPACEGVLLEGGNVAAVFDHKAGLPTDWRGFPVIDGDEHDYRPADPKGCVVGLKAKGDARSDTSGFVVR